MLFNSFAFSIFLPIVFCLHWALPHKYRWVLLLISSYYFYISWNPKYIILILFTTAVSFFAAILIEKEIDKKKKKVIVYISAILCLGILVYFKYFNFISQSIIDILRAVSIELNPITIDVLLPVGISFYTFQTLSYVIDVYKGDVKPEKHFGYYATFISFFPQLVAGPIERTKNLLPQIKNVRDFNYDQATYGLKLLTWGFFKKLVIADVLSRYVQMVYESPYDYHGFALVLASFFFTIQIYCDFSGYSDIAIGTAKLLGINLMTNFKNPYMSASVKEFWSRWHISLSTWFRDYVYIPLGGNRVNKFRHNANLLITFLISGLWHGANWTFVAWGGIHGLAQILETGLFGKVKNNRNSVIWYIKVTLVFSFCAFAWIFFVAKSLPDAMYVISHMLDGIAYPVLYLKNGFRDLGISKTFLLNISMSISILITYDYLSLKHDVIYIIGKSRLHIRWIIYLFLIIYILCNIPLDGNNEFIYFQF